MIIKNITDVIGHCLCFTLYIRMHISCKRLFMSVGSSALLTNFELFACLSLYTTLSPLSCSLSSFRTSLDLQKCQTNWQYIRYGKSADLNSTSLAFVGIKFLSLMRMLIL